MQCLRFPGLAPLCFTFDDSLLYVASNIGRDKMAVFTYDPRTATQLDLIYEHREVDTRTLLRSHHRKVITGVEFFTDRRGYAFFDDDRKQLQDQLERELPGVEVTVVSMSRDERRVLVRTLSDKTQGSYYFLDRDGGRLQKLVEVSPWLDATAMADMKPIRYASRDGLTIHGVKWLVAQSIADPARIGIYGGSYGGYATLAGVAFTPELFACGVDYVGVSNLFTFLDALPPYWEPFIAMFKEMIGDPETNPDFIRSISPFFHVDQIRAPLLVAQGANDPRVKKHESDQIVGALRARGIEVDYMVKDNEGHGFDNEENRFDFYCAMERFLGRHLNDFS